MKENEYTQELKKQIQHISKELNNKKYVEKKKIDDYLNELDKLLEKQIKIQTQKGG
jgi:hypothetical protein